MRKCRLCDHRTKKRANLFRHLNLVHGIADRDCKNVSKDTDTGVESYGEDLTSKETNGQTSRIISVGRSMNVERQLEDRMFIQQNPCMDQENYGEPCLEKSSSCQSQSDPVDGLYTREEIEKLGAGLRSRKCRILDSVLKTIPDNLKAKAEIVCDALKFRDDVFIDPGYELIINGTPIRGSNICNLIINKLTHPQPSSGSKLFKQIESENKLQKYLVDHQTKVLERERVVPICTKFESSFDHIDKPSKKKKK